MVNNSALDLGMGGETGLENTTWWKQDGSDHFTILEVVMSPEGFSVRTTDGRLLQADILEQYIQSNTPINDMFQKPTNIPVIDVSNLDEIDGKTIIVDEPDKKPGNRFGSLKFSHPGVKYPSGTHDPISDRITINNTSNDEIDTISYGMIERVLGKLDIKDLISIDINRVKKVDDGVFTLINVLNIKHSELKTYMVNMIIEKIPIMVEKALSSYLDNLLGEKNSNEETTE